MKTVSRALVSATVLVAAALALPAQSIASTPTPAVTVSNVTDQSFATSWTSRVTETGSMTIYSGFCGGTNVTTIGGAVGADQGSGYTHDITVSGLAASTTSTTQSFYYRVTSGGVPYPTSTTCYGPVHTTQTPGLTTPIAIYGTVKENCSALLPKAIVMLYLTRGTLVSGLVSILTTSNPPGPPANVGGFSLDISQARVQNSSTLFAPKNGDVMHLSFDGGNVDVGAATVTYTGGASQSIGTVCLTPAGNFANGGFESGATSWVLPAQGSIESTTVHSGTKALQINATAGYQYATQTLAVQPSTTYAISGWLRQTAAHSYIGVQDTENSAIRGDLCTPSCFPTTLNAWLQLSGTLTTGPATRRLTIYLSMTAAGTYFFDDVTIYPVGILANGGFEETPLFSGAAAFGWSLPPTGSIVTGTPGTTVHTGTKALYINAPGASYYASQIIAVSPSTHYTIGYCIKQSVAHGFLSVRDADTGTVFATIGPSTTVGSWVCLSQVIVTSATTRHLVVYPDMNAAGQYYFDDVGV